MIHVCGFPSAESCPLPKFSDGLGGPCELHGLRERVRKLEAALRDLWNEGARNFPARGVSSRIDRAMDAARRALSGMAEEASE